MSKKDLPEEIKTQAIDHIATGVKVALGAVPFAGSLLAEVAGAIIPNQRIDRLADFARKLEERIKSLEEAKVLSELADVEFTDLLEESMWQACRATTSERREYLASLVANSLSSETIEHAETKHLMRMLGELNDIEILWLRFYEGNGGSRDKAFRDLHADLFAPIFAAIGSDQERIDDHAIQESYREHLVRLGLVSEKLRTDRDGNPEYDRISGRPKVSYRSASRLGQLLLRSIGMMPAALNRGEL